MNVAFVAGGFYWESSGVVRIMSDLANALGRVGAASVTIYTAECAGRPAVKHLLVPPTRLVTAPGKWWGRLSHSPQLKELLYRQAPETDLVHCHSLWMLPNAYAADAARVHRRPLLFTAHGALEPWALQKSRWKKRLVAQWFQDRQLRSAHCIHVNSMQEAAGIRAYGLSNPIAIIPNGIDLANFEQMPPPSEFVERDAQLSGKRILLFLSRLHPKKGLGHLLPAWARVETAFADWQLVIVGPDDGGESQARRMVKDLKIADRVTFTGPLAGRDKLAALAAAELFILPSFSEGFSMAVLEAMAARLPVVITPGCNFPEAAAAGAGLEVEPNVDGVERGLRELLPLDPAKLVEMGRHGRRLIEQSYTWDAVAAQTAALYRWLLGGGEAPTCAQLGKVA